MNSLVDEYRSKFDDPRSDAEILSDIVPWMQENKPRELAHYPDALEDFDQLKKSTLAAPIALPAYEPPPPGVADYLKQGAGSLVRGVTEGIADIPKGIATLRKSVRTQVPGGRFIEAAADIPMGMAIPDAITGIPFTENALNKAGEAISSVGKAVTPEPNEQLAGSWLATKIPSGLGSVAALMLPGAAAKLAKIPGWIGIAAGGSLSQSQGAYEDAKAHGADDSTAHIAAWVGNVVGTSEAVPLGEMLSRINKASGGVFWKEMLKHGITEGFEEAVQNSAQQLAQDFTAKKLFDKDRDLAANFKEAAGTGGVVGFIASTIFSALGLKLGRKGGETNVQKETQKEEDANVLTKPPPLPAGTDLSDVASHYSLTPEEIANARKQRESLIAAHPELATPPADTPEQADVEVAAAKTDPTPTSAEKKSGKYEKGQVTLDTGLTVDIENAAGSVRTGTDSDGEKWNVTMPATYGEILGVKGKDKDWMDIYLGPDVTQPNVYVVNQIDPKTGKLDEQKSMYGFDSLEHATAAYDAAFSDGSGPSRRQSVVQFTKPQFTSWLSEGDKNKPAENVVTLPTEVAPTVEPSPNAPQLSQAVSGLTPEDEAAAQAAASNEEPAAPQFDQNEFLSLVDFPTTEGEGKQTSQVAAGTPEQGKQSAAAFEESGLLSKAMADSRAGATGQSRKLGLFRSADGTHGVIATIYDNRNPKVTTEDGSGLSIPKFIKSGYQLVGSVKLKVPLKGFNLQVESAAFDNAVKALRERQGAAKSEFQAAVAPPPVTANTSVQPDEIVEGFTRDEANSLWNSMGHLRPDEIVSNISKLDGDAKKALGKIFEAFSNAGLDDSDAAENTIIYVKDTKAISGDSQRTFIDTLISEVNKIADNFVRQGKEQQAAGQSAAAAEPSGNQEGGTAKEGGQGTQTGTEPGTRFRGGQTVPDWRISTPESKKRMIAAAEGLEASGISVTAVGEDINGQIQDAGGYMNPEGRSIVVFMSDQHAPTRANLITLMHEAGDFVLSQESPEKQVMFHNAIKSLSNDAMGIKDFDPKINPILNSSEAEVVASHERLSESVARKLEAQGFNPAEARGLWNAIVRWLRDIWYRVALSIQKARFGPENVNPETAESYFTNRLMSLLAGDTGNYSFVSWLGGPKPTGGQVINTHSNANGLDELGQRFDPNSGEMIYPEVVEDSVNAVRLNNLIRYQGRKLSKIADETADIGQEPNVNYTAIASTKIAAQNEIRELWRSAYAEWTARGNNSSGLTFDQWWRSGNFVKLTHPDENIAAQQAGLAVANKPAADPAIRMAAIPPSEQPSVANAAYNMSLGEQARMEAKLKEDAEALNPTAPGNLNTRLQRNVARTNKMVANYENIDLMRDESVSIMNEMLDEATRDAKDATSESRRHGVLSQTIKALEGEMDDAGSTQFRGAMQRLYKRWKTGEPAAGKFADTLQAAANVEDINWSTDGPVVIKQKLMDAARTTPELAHLLEPSVDRRAEMAMLAAFGKQNFQVMTLLSMRINATTEEKKWIGESAKMAMSVHRSAMKEARAAAAKAGKYAFQAGRLVDAIEEQKAQNRALLDDIQRRESFAEFYHDAAATIRNGLDNLGRIIGAQSEDWEAHANAKAKIPRSVNEPESQWEEVQLKLKENGTTTPQVNEWIMRIRDRLAAKPESSWSVAERTLDVIKRKLEYQAATTFFYPMRGNLVVRMLGSITDKLDSTGHPGAMSAASMLRRIDAATHLGKSDMEKLGPRWSEHEGQAMTEAKRIIGRKLDLQSFRNLIYNPMGKFFENRGDIWAATADRALAKQNAVTALRGYFSASPETARLANDPKFWNVMVKFVDQTEANINFLISAGKSMGRKIEDMGYFRDIIGATLNFMPRKWRRTTEKMWQELQPNWNGTKDDRLDGSWVAGEYASDAAALKQKVSARLTPALWESFVREIVQKTGRSSFYAPVDGEVKPLALRNNLSRAFEATAPLDLVGFAENLHQLESAGLTGHPIMAKGDYVAEVLGTFQNFYQVLHSEFSGRADTVEHGLPKPNGIMMDARVSNEAPSGWLEYMPLDGQTMRLAVRSMAFQFGGGRNLEAIRTNFKSAQTELSLLDDEYNALRNKLRAQGLTGSSLRAAMQKEAEITGGKGHLVRMEEASRNARLIGSMSRSFDGMVKMQLDTPMELRTFIELIGTVAGATVQGPLTAFTDLSYMFMQPFRNLGLTKEALQLAGHHAATTAESIAGSLGWTLGQQLNLDVEMNQKFHEMGWDDSDASLSMREKLNELTHEQLFLTDPDGRTVVSRGALQAQRGIKLASRGLRQLLGTGFTGFQRAEPGQFSYPTFKALSPFTMISQLQHLATAKGMWKFVTPRVVKAIEFFNANPVALDDPAFKFKAKDLGMSQQAFDYINGQMNGYGMSFENMARDAIKRRQADPLAEILTSENYRNLGVLGTTETVMESGMTTRMPGFLTNPVMASAAPLVGWAVQSSNVLGKRLDPVIQAEGGKATAKATWNMLLPYAAVLPVGIAFALWREWFDEHFQGKKANVQGFGQNNDFLAVVEKASRTSVFGMAGDVANSLMNTDTNRPFSVDSRVLFLSSLFSLGRATATWVKQGSFDYGSVGRPYISALGGSGFLQQVDILNHALTVSGAAPLVEAEAKIVARINVQNYLRAGGRSLGMDVRTGSFGSQASLPNPTKPFIGQMVLSALYNDPQGFAESRRDAIISRMKTEKVTMDAAEDYVKRSFSGMNPLATVFTTKPSEQEFSRLLASLPDDGRIAVATALRNYNHYGSVLGIEPSYGRKEPRTAGVPSFRVPTVPSLNQIRSQAMAGAR